MSDKQILKAEVLSVERFTPSMVRIVFGGADIQQFSSTRFPDEFVRLLFPAGVGSSAPESAAGNVPGRFYTIRKHHRQSKRFTIDFACHEGGIAGQWCIAAKAGDTLGICNPGYRFEVPDDAEWILLIADITGLPAVGRTLEELVPSRRIIAHVEVPHESDRQEIETVSDVTLHWHETFGQPDRPTQLLDIARSVKLPDGSGYIWIAGEATAVSESRKHFRDVLGFDKDRITAVGYWIEGQARG